MLLTLFLLQLILNSCISMVSRQQSMSGLCTWYGDQGEIQEGYPTACGAQDTPMSFHRMANNTAQRNVPTEMACGTHIVITNHQNNKTVCVMVNDRGPGGDPSHILDLTYGAFRYIGDPYHLETGYIPCSYVVVSGCPSYNELY